MNRKLLFLARLFAREYTPLPIRLEKGENFLLSVNGRVLIYQYPGYGCKTFGWIPIK